MTTYNKIAILEMVKNAFPGETLSGMSEHGIGIDRDDRIPANYHTLFVTTDHTMLVVDVDENIKVTWSIANQYSGRTVEHQYTFTSTKALEKFLKDEVQ